MIDAATQSIPRYAWQDYPTAATKCNKRTMLRENCWHVLFNKTDLYIEPMAALESTSCAKFTPFKYDQPLQYCLLRRKIFFPLLQPEQPRFLGGGEESGHK